MKKDVFRLALGVVIGYCLVQGATYLQHNYLWAIFYR